MPAEEVCASATRDTHRQRLEDWTLLEPVTRACGADGDVVVLLQGEGGARYGSGQDSLAVSDVEVHQTFSPVFWNCSTSNWLHVSKFDTARLVCRRRSSTALDSDRDGHTPYHCHR